MKYIIDIPNEMVIKSELNGLTLGIAMIETSTQKQFIIPTNIPLMPYIEPQKWIPVSKELPKEKDELLVTVSDEYLAFTDTDQWTGAKFWGYGDKVVAWQPFPEPWKGEEQ